MEICLENPCIDRLVLGEQLRGWAEDYLSSDIDAYHEVQGIMGKLIGAADVGNTHIC